MPKFVSIKDLDDPRLNHYVNLRQSRSASARLADTQTFIAEGSLVVQRLIESDYEIESILLKMNRKFDLTGLANDTPVYQMPAEQISRVVGFDFHRGVLACGRRKPILTINRFQVDATGESNVANDLSLGLFGISEPENMGSMLRTAAALGINRIVLGPRSIDPFSRRVIRVSMATVFKHQFYQVQNPVDDLTTLQENGVSTIASALTQDATPIRSFASIKGPAVLMIGNEATGIDPEVLAITQHVVRIPMHFGVDSLNAAAAAAILMHQLTK